jgi:hypothetical protein
MDHRYASLAVLALSLAGCSTVGQLTVKDHTAATGERVMAGQAEPKSEYQCTKISQEPQEWGFKGNMNQAAATERVTTAAVNAAPGKGANYAYIIVPSEASVGGFNVNAFKDAQVAYYKCGNLPAAKSG